MNRRIRILLVDDEELARHRLRRLLDKIDIQVEIVGEAEDGFQAVELIESVKPDVVFLDIQMPGLDGFEVINKLSVIPQIIFCTAFEEYAVKAFEVNGIDYLVKPVREERLAQAIQKLRLEDSNESTSKEVIEAVRQMLQLKQKPELTSLPVKVGDRVVFVNLSDVMAFQAKDKYVDVISRKGQTYLSDLSLKRLEELLPNHFVRVHRAIIVNRMNIHEVRRYLSNRFILVMNDENRSRFTTGRMYVEVVKGLMTV